MDPNLLLNRSEKVLKVFRFIKNYSLGYTVTKIMGRLRLMNPFIRRFYFTKKLYIGLIGCGQHQYGIIAYFLSNIYQNKFLSCYDIDQKKSKSLAHFYCIKNLPNSIDSFFSDDQLKLVYIASNHYSHADYAIKALDIGLDVYIEKPLVVNFTQYQNLFNKIESSNCNVYAGFCRPFSEGIKLFKQEYIKSCSGHNPFSINCFISAHQIPDNDWYMDSKEGTRVCGNLSHWIDLLIHFFYWRNQLPYLYKITLVYSKIDETDSNISLSISTDLNDLFTVVISSRSEPFEGIFESLNIAIGPIICNIHDFREITLWNASQVMKKKFKRKNTGHKGCVLQPFNHNKRNISEVKLSTYLTLEIAQMTRNKETYKQLEINLCEYPK